MNTTPGTEGSRQQKRPLSPENVPSADEVLPSWFQEIDHTGDVAIEVSAPTRSQLFERAAWGLFHVLADVPAIEPREEKELVVEGRDQDDLLVRWMSDLNYLHVTEGWLFCQFEVQEIGDRQLVARTRGEKYDPERHVVYTEIKAITYYNLSISHDEQGWNVQVVFDM